MFGPISPTIYNVLVYIAISISASVFISHIIYHYNNVRDNIETPSINHKQAIHKYILFYIVMACLVVCWSWIAFSPISIGHLDEISYLNEPINPQIWNGRFFPLGHLEFNYLYPSMFGGELWPLYILPFCQLVVFIWCVDYIIKPANIYVRMFAICLTYWLSASIPMVNLVIPERNAIFFLLIALCFLKKYSAHANIIALYGSVIAFGLSLYYKEPMFSFAIAFAVTHWFYNVLRHEKCINLKLGHNVAAEAGIFLSGLFFLLGYYLFVLAGPAQSSTYMNISVKPNVAEYISRVWFFTWKRPFLSILVINAIISHTYINKSSQDRALSMGLIAGGTAYLAALATLNMPVNGYYYAIPLLSISLSFFICVKHLLKIKSFAVLALSSIVFITVVVLQSKNLKEDIFLRKNTQNEFLFISKAIDDNRNVKNIYFAIDDKSDPYPDYSTTILELYLYKFKGMGAFNITSKSGCYPWNEYKNDNKIHCIKKDFSMTDKYDLIIIENDVISVEKESSIYSVFTSPFSLKENGHKNKLHLMLNKTAKK
ncbi:hypothetical protein V1669_20135 [Aeromonas enteropelogenes]|uniref:hypothetical protein n=1 Tax=Aeromonas enteropelogenes TaxID=29489 RepID=UPI0031359F85